MVKRCGWVMRGLEEENKQWWKSTARVWHANSCGKHLKSFSMTVSLTEILGNQTSRKYYLRAYSNRLKCGYCFLNFHLLKIHLSVCSSLSYWRFVVLSLIISNQISSKGKKIPCKIIFFLKLLIKEHWFLVRVLKIT